jgi:hypothetical protein
MERPTFKDTKPKKWKNWFQKETYEDDDLEIDFGHDAAP